MLFYELYKIIVKITTFVGFTGEISPIPHLGRQNGLALRMLFYELYKIIVKITTFVGFTGEISPNTPPGSAPE